MATLLIIFTLGIATPWAIVARKKWELAHTYIEGKQLCFKGSGAGIFANWLLIVILSIITLFADPGDVEYLVEAKSAEKVSPSPN